jgi:biopolymer transport protein ExbB/TolQ
MIVLVNIIPMLLVALAWLMAWAVVDRSLFHAYCRKADPYTLERRLSRWRAEKCLPKEETSELGWLCPLVQASAGKRDALLLMCHQAETQMRCWRYFLPTAADVAISLGLLATVLGISLAAGTGNPRAMIGVGLHSTVWGLVIAIPGFVVNALLGSRGDYLADQAMQVVVVLNQLPSAALGGPRHAC